MLKRLECVSARSTWEPEGVVEPVEWKVKEFSHLIVEYYHRKATNAKNVLSIGDSPSERAALQKATSIGSKLFRTKTIKLKVRPTPQELVGELELLTCMLDNIVAFDGNLDLAFMNK